MGDGINIPLLDMPADSQWILNACASDSSLMRDFFAYNLTNSLGHYASRSRYVELILNGQYWGVYLVLEHVKLGRHRVNIAKLSRTDSNFDSPQITGGYIVRLDWRDHDDWSFHTAAPHHTEIVGSYPDAKDITPTQRSWIQSFFNQFESALASRDDNDRASYRQLIDLDSAIAFFIITELTKNFDGYRRSVFLHKDRLGPLRFGPVWDFDYSLGASLFKWLIPPDSPTGWSLNQDNALQLVTPVFWWRRLLDDPEFAAQLTERWNEWRQTKLSTQTLCAIIDSTAQLLEEASDRNYKRWNWFPLEMWRRYDNPVAFMKDWIEQRLIWLDNNIPTMNATAGLDTPTYSNDPGMSFGRFRAVVNQILSKGRQ